ncbi:MAG: hypothetical protein FWB98_01045 [Defluviitaleaceae bacterium]|nr:hypothetical protein [Defluviitaleaceae bacterium]
MSERKISSKITAVFIGIVVLVVVFTAVATLLLFLAEASVMTLLSVSGGGLVLVFIIIALGNSLNQSIAKPIKELAEGITTYKGNDEVGKIAEQMRHTQNGLNKLKEFLAKVELNASRGDLATVTPRGEFSGIYLDIAEGANRAIQSVIDDIDKIAGLISKLADGQFAMAMTTKMRGPLSRPLENLTKTMQSLCSDANRMAAGALESHQQNLMPADRYRGQWHELAKNFNEIRTATSRYLEQATDAMVDFGKGNLNAHLKVDVSLRQFDKYTSAFNNSVAQVSRNVDTIRKAVEDKGSGRNVSGDFPGDFSKIRIALETAQVPTPQTWPPPRPARTAAGVTSATTAAKRDAKPRQSIDYRQMSGAYKAPVTGNAGSRAKDYLKSDFGKY